MARCKWDEPPTGVFADRNGRLWVADFSNDRVLRFDDAAAKANGGNADGVLGQPDFTIAAPCLRPEGMYQPWGVGGDPDGRIYVADTWQNRILTFDNAAGLPNGADASGRAGAAELQHLYGINTGGILRFIALYACDIIL